MRESVTKWTCDRCKCNTETTNDECFFVPRLPRNWDYRNQYLLCDTCIKGYDVIIEKYMKQKEE